MKSTWIAFAALLSSACGGIDDTSLALATTDDLAIAFATCMTAEPDVSIDLARDVEATVRAQKQLERTTCVEPVVLAILLPALSKAKSVQIQPAGSNTQGGTIIVWSADRSAPIQTFAADGLDPITIEVGDASELVLAILPAARASAVGGYWDYQLVARGN